MAIMIILRMLSSIRKGAGRAARGIGITIAEKVGGRRSTATDCLKGAIAGKAGCNS